MGIGLGQVMGKNSVNSISQHGTGGLGNAGIDNRLIFNKTSVDF